MSITLYGIAKSRASRCMWMLAEAGVPYTHVPVSPKDAATDPRIAALNPNGRVPVLTEGELALFESFAINLHIAKRHGGALGPRTAEEDSLAVMWSLWAATELEPDAHQVLWHTLTLPPEQQEAAVREGAIKRLHRPLGAVSAALAKGGGWLMGGRFTVADLNAACAVFYLRGAPELLAAFPAVQEWYGRCTAREGFRQMLRLRGNA
ncbi:MAG: glutathione S-transferase family protein [Acetobacteraceae bacterium]|nr:glutathione S-transferase family protein [Acetobacteraceae bacterium]